MTNRYFYQENIATFLAEDTNSIFGKMSLADEMDTASTQKFAWEQEITIMKHLLASYANEQAHIIFEYTIPRLGKRIDVVVLLRELVFVVEFKAGEEEFKHQDVDQVLDYALDLKNFHQGSADRWIIPILVATEEIAFSTLCQPSHYNDGVYEPLMTNAAHLKDVFELVLSQPIDAKQYAVSLDDWSRSRYAPTPTIIEAARSLYLNHSVENITKSEAE